MKTFKKILVILLAIVLLAGCSRADKADKTAYYEPEYDGGYNRTKVSNPGYYIFKASSDSSADMLYQADFDYVTDNYGDFEVTAPYDSGHVAPNIQKIIVTSRVRMEAKDMDKTIATILEMLTKYGGYVQTSSINQDINESSYRYSTIVVRIPANNYDAFLNESLQSGNVLSVDTTTDDITTDYYDLQSRLESLRAERERVMEFYNQADNVSELLQIEERLSEIDSEIAAGEIRMQNYDLLTTYSTITFNITEEKTYTPTTDNFATRLLETLKNSVHNFLNFLENALYFLINSFWYVLLALLLFVLGRKLNSRYHFFKGFKRKNRVSENNVSETE